MSLSEFRVYGGLGDNLCQAKPAEKTRLLKTTKCKWLKNFHTVAILDGCLPKMFEKERSYYQMQVLA